MKLKVGIAGYGIIGKRRRQNIDNNEYLETVAVCDQNYKHFELLDDGVKCYPDYQHLLKEENIDVMFVSLPNYLAPEVTIACLEKGLHVFCEKPPGKNVEDVKKVLEVKHKNPSLKLKYGFNHRYHDSVKDALSILRSKELGEVINLRGVYGKNGFVPFGSGWRAKRKYAGGGILLDQGIHMVDLLQLFCGDFHEAKSYISNDYWKCDVEDNAFAIMRNDQGKIATLHSTATQWQHLFSLNKKGQNAKRKTKRTQVKEIKFRPTTDTGDYNIKLRKLKEFLENGDKVKVTLRFRGREMVHQELGVQLIERVKVDLDEYGTIEQHPEMEGRQMVMILGPKRK